MEMVPGLLASMAVTQEFKWPDRDARPVAGWRELTPPRNSPTG
jgi:hypothetical protein